MYLDLKAGERIPCDALLVRDLTGGNASVDESMLTGESMPVRKGVGDTLYGGTLNKAGPMWTRAQSVGNATAVQGIVRLVEEAQSSKAPIQVG